MAYLLGQFNIHDREEYAKYEADFVEILTRFGGELLVLQDKTAVLEGDYPYGRIVVLRFPDSDALQRWYDSPEYRAIVPHRLRAATGSIVLVDAPPS